MQPLSLLLVDRQHQELQTLQTPRAGEMAAACTASCTSLWSADPSPLAPQRSEHALPGQSSFEVSPRQSSVLTPLRLPCELVACCKTMDHAWNAA